MNDDQNYSLDSFAETLIGEKKFTTITPEVKEEIKKDILERLNDFIIAKLIRKLSDEKVKEFNELMTTNPEDEQIQQFMEASVPEMSVVIGDVLVEFRKKYLGIE